MNKKMSKTKRQKVCIVVLGDIGRSPRMEYHALSFLKEGYDVQFVGYQGSQPIKSLSLNKNMKFQHIYYCPEFKNYLPLIFAHAIKVIWQSITLLLALVLAGFPDYMLIQNPPAIPTVGVCYIYCRIFRIKFIIDWHNYAFSILALSLKSNHILVKVSKIIEFYFGKKADFNLCVTRAMKEDLEKNHIKAITFYDRPFEHFKQISSEEKHRLFLLLGLHYNVFIKNCGSDETIFTKKSEDGKIVLKDDRPALLVSSTSWTEDEDFLILLSTLEKYEEAKRASNLPKLICAITGKGPLKEIYGNIIKKKKWKNVTVVTPWLEAEDYPVFIGSADFGVCLHKSSSGLDLPMKVIDMFGCFVPVCAFNFTSLSELVQHEENGYIFNSENELFMQIKILFKGFPKTKSSKMLIFQKNLKKFNELKWHNNWKLCVLPLFKS